MHTTLLGLFFAATIAISLGLQVVPNGSVMNVGADTVTVHQPDGTQLVAPKIAHRKRDDGIMAFGTITDEPGYSYYSFQYLVPPEPYNQRDNVIYYSHDAYTDNNDELSMLITFWGNPRTPAQNDWTLSLYSSGVTSNQYVLTPGTILQGVFNLTGNTWNMAAYVNNVLLLSYSFVFNASKPILLTSVGSYLQVYNVEHCSYYPPGPLVTTNVVTKRGNTALTNGTCNPIIYSAQPAQCGLKVVATHSTFNISYSTVDVTPPPTPLPLQYDYTCDNGNVVYPVPSHATLRSNTNGTTYGPNLDCEYQIFSDNWAHRIRIDFSILQLQAGDIVQVFDAAFPDDGSNPLPLGLMLSGNGSSPVSFISTYGYCYVKFISDAIGTAAGWVANYSTVTTVPNSVIYTCGPNSSYFLTYSPTGYLRSTNPALYATYFANMNCVYNITAPVGKKVSLTFTRFVLAKTDSVKIYNGGTTSAPLLASYTTTAPTSMPKLTSTVNNVLFVFTTDGANQAAGYDTSYSFV